jgi:hypothetical protein
MSSATADRSPKAAGTLPIRDLVALRTTINDLALMDYLHIRSLTGGCGCVTTAALRETWNCDQSTVSRRVNAVVAVGLADITSGHGLYHVHQMWGMEVQRGPGTGKVQP